jgi:hypothetical protein
MFHYNKGSAYSTSTDSSVLYQDAPASTLLNDVFLYFVHDLPMFHNMHPYRITSATEWHGHPRARGHDISCASGPSCCHRDLPFFRTERGGEGGTPDVAAGQGRRITANTEGRG